MFVPINFPIKILNIRSGKPGSHTSFTIKLCFLSWGECYSISNDIFRVTKRAFRLGHIVSSDTGISSFFTEATKCIGFVRLSSEKVKSLNKEGVSI